MYRALDVDNIVITADRLRCSEMLSITSKLAALYAQKTMILDVIALRADNAGGASLGP